MFSGAEMVEARQRKQHNLKAGKQEDTNQSRNMPATPFPNVAALAFTAVCTRGHTIVETFSFPVKGKYGIRFTTDDSLIISYRPAGGASHKTPDEMATVELNFKKYTGKGHPGIKLLKFKFPESQKNDDDEGDKVREYNKKIQEMLKEAGTEKISEENPSLLNSSKELHSYLKGIAELLSPTLFLSDNSEITPPSKKCSQKWNHLHHFLLNLFL